MLRGIRNASTNWLGRIVMGAVMGLLAATFAIWGINDIFKGFGRSTLAKVGSTEIPIEQFRRTYNERLQQLSRQVGQPISPEQAKAIGLERSVLLGMVNDAALDQRARQMGLGLPDEEIVRRITEDPTFRSPTGKFDRVRFDQFLRGVGLNEQRLIAEQRRLMLRRQIVESVNGDVPVPKAWLEAVNEFQNQQRNIEYVTLGPAQAGDIPAPTPEQLSKYFEERKILFRAPEYRKIEVIAVTPEELGRWMEISEADIKAEFDARRSRYVTPERRHVEQIVFPTMQEAEAAEARIKDGLSFAALAAERGLKEKDFDLGTVSKNEIIDPAVANAAFALKDGEVSAPVQGRFGAVIVTVTKIEPEEGKSLADVTPQIRKEIATDRAKGDVRSLHEKIEDERAGGASLPQTAEKLKLPVVTYDVDRSGRDPNGKVVNFPHAGQVIPAAFNTEVGADNDPLEAEGGYVWYNVAGDHALARSHARRGQGSGRSALARGRNRRAPQDQIGRAPRQAQGRRAVRYHCRICRAQSPNRRQAHARQAAGRRVAAGDRGGVPHGQGRLRQRRKPSADRVGGVPRHRYQHAEIRSQFTRDETRRRPVEETTER